MQPKGIFFPKQHGETENRLLPQYKKRDTEHDESRSVSLFIYILLKIGMCFDEGADAFLQDCDAARFL